MDRLGVSAFFISAPDDLLEGCREVERIMPPGEVACCGNGAEDRLDDEWPDLREAPASVSGNEGIP